MTHRWIRRRGHPRVLQSGRTTYVCENWILKEASTERPGGAFSRTHACPRCGAAILTVRMPNGGRVHFEGGRGLNQIKHPCLNLGEGLSKRREIGMADLFDCLE
jgi:hypothetical protein